MFRLLALCGFGLESLVRRELESLPGCPTESRIVAPGHVQFEGDGAAIVLANLWLRTADRVVVDMGDFHCEDFDTLFDVVQQTAWETWLDPLAAFNVTAHCVESKLASVPACQRTVKKAIAQRLAAAHGVGELPETGVNYAVHLGLIRDQARLTIDTSGHSLHRRGYRTRYPRGILKETLAAAVVQLSFWDRERPLLDPFCGVGTIPIEAAMIGCRIAPGIERSFAAEEWPNIAAETWTQARADARAARLPPLETRIVGMDTDSSALRWARQSCESIGISESVHFQPAEFERAASHRKYGCVITNPPSIGSELKRYQLDALIRRIPEVLRHFPTWSHFILSDHPQFETLVGRQADRRRKLYNDRTQCFLYQFAGPKPPQKESSSDDAAIPTETSPPKPVRRPAAFGELTEKAREQAELFNRRLTTRAKHLRRWPTRQDITCFRIYERDIPEIPLIVDRYEDHLHITEYERPHDRDPALHSSWLDLMQATAAKTLDVEPSKVFFKRRERQRGDEQYRRVAEQKYEIQVGEGGLKFWVNLSDYVDTGLFLDHRITRGMVRDEVKDKRFLNLFAYTGAFSVYAADGAAASTVTVDWSTTYLQWAQRNMRDNRFEGPQHQFVRADAMDYLTTLPAKPLFDLAVVDPPTFSNSKRTEEDWDVQVGYAQLLNELLIRIEPGGIIYFSNNFRRFKFDPDAIDASVKHEISNQTVPADFRNRRIHRCWRIVK